MPKRIYLFDVDGTLTEPLTEVDDVFAEIFLTWKRDKDKVVYLVTGSDIDKTKKQLFTSFLDQCDGVFTCSGNVFYQGCKKVYENALNLDDGLLEDLQLYLQEGAQWKDSVGTNIEIRAGMINFTTLGRGATPEQRQEYYEWDKTHQEREDIVEYVKNLYPQYDVSIGGQISVDIDPCGKNKGQVVERLREIHGEDVEMIFVGDRNVPGGNDWPLAQRLEEIEGSHWYQVQCYEETRALIEYGELFI